MNEQALRLADGIHRGREIHFQVDGTSVLAYEGETIATALMAAGLRAFRHTAGGKPRGLFCGVGMCFDCVVSADSRHVRACVTPVREGMLVVTGTTSATEQRS